MQIVAEEEQNFLTRQQHLLQQGLPAAGVQGTRSICMPIVSLMGLFAVVLQNEHPNTKIGEFIKNLLVSDAFS